jgi:hypothetical protein
MRKFNISGSYDFPGHGLDYPVTGIFRVQDDNRVIGILHDHDKNQDIRKAVLGLHSNGSLNYWKFTPSERGICPIIWIMQISDSGIYTGKWGMVTNPTKHFEDPTQFPELRRVYEAPSEDAALDVLAEVSLQRIQTLIRPEHIIMISNSDGGFNGELNLTEVKN